MPTEIRFFGGGMARGLPWERGIVKNSPPPLARVGNRRSDAIPCMELPYPLAVLKKERNYAK